MGTQGDKRIINDINSLVNSYYIMAEALDMLMNEMEQIFAPLGKGVKHHVKQRHSEMMRLIKLLRTNQEKFLSDYSAFNGDWSKYDDLRSSAAYIARIMLLIADRTNENDCVESDIEQYIRNKPSTGAVSDNLLHRFKII